MLYVASWILHVAWCRYKTKFISTEQGAEVEAKKGLRAPPPLPPKRQEVSKTKNIHWQAMPKSKVSCDISRATHDIHHRRGIGRKFPRRATSNDDAEAEGVSRPKGC